MKKLAILLGILFLMNINATSIADTDSSKTLLSDDQLSAIAAIRSLFRPKSEKTIDKFTTYYAVQLEESLSKRYPQLRQSGILSVKQGDSDSIACSGLCGADVTDDNKMALYILSELNDLQLYGQVEYDAPIKEMQSRAISYIDDNFIKNATSNLVIEKYSDTLPPCLSESNPDVPTAILEYLYVRSLYRDIPISYEVHELEKNTKYRAAQNWERYNLYQRALMAIVLKCDGDKELAQKIASNIRKNATVDETKGMYWVDGKCEVFISNSDICKHVYLMKALIENGATDDEIKLMKLWLIRQKGKSEWESNFATIDAINMLIGID